MDRVLHGLKHRITRGYPVSNFIREVWNDELDSIRLAPELKPTLPKPLRSASLTYPAVALLTTVRRIARVLRRANTPANNPAT